jgi:hypothetical protein
MDFNKTIDMILKDLRETREIIDDLRNYPGVPLLQIELAKSRCKSAEEVITLLKTFEHAQPEKKNEEFKFSGDPEKVEKKVSDNLIEIGEDTQTKVSEQERIAVPEAESQQELWTKKEVTVNENIFPAGNDELKLQPEQDKIKETVNLNEPVQRQGKKKKSETNIVADKFSHMSSRFNEQLVGNKKEDDVTALLKTKPLHNLVDAIGVNDKFLFVREIFNGDRQSYENAIVKLEKVNNLSDAKAVIMSFTGESDENDAVKQLLELVKRKLPPNE